MKEIARCLVILAVTGHIGLTTAEAFAATGYGTAAWSGAGDGLLQLAQSTGGGSTGGEGSSPSPGGQGPAAGPGHGNNGPTVFGETSSVSGACAAGLQLPDASAYPDAVEGLAAVSAKT